MGSIEEIEKYAYENNIPIMQKDGILFLEKYIKDNNVKTILEIGTAIGYSAARMARVDEKIKVTTIERDKKRYDLAKENVRQLNLEDQITLIFADALEYETKEKFDLIFIDAAKAQSINFFEKYKKNLKNQGTIITDNLDFHGLTKNPEEIQSKNLRSLVKKINNYKIFLENNKEFTTSFLKIGDGISISKKK
ncbi:MAG: O-methyltransferase [Bacilli bacterium]|nr:O-methyltransferase [Bacilli bacterium]MBR3209808.1 O-methyltransferase [Bacilli bacterium]